MILNLKNLFLKEQGSISIDDSLSFTQVEFNNVFPFSSPVKINGTITAYQGYLQLEYSVSFDYTAPCDRCGRKTKKHYNFSFSHILVKALENEEDEYIQVGDMLEMEDLVREDIFLSLPSKFLCREDCKGLCSKCGKNLNDGPCSCSKKEIDPRLKVLTQLLDNDK